MIWLIVLLGAVLPFVSGSQLAFYNFDEGTGTNATDQFYSNKNLTFFGSGLSWVAGKYGYGINSTGVSTYLNWTVAPNFSYPLFTVEMWIKKDTAWQTTETIFTYSGVNKGIILQKATYMTCYMGNGADFNQKIEMTGNIPIGSWQHIACVKNSTGLSIYLNGILNASLTTADTPSYSLLINTRLLYDADLSGFNGSIDEFKFWDEARTQAQIQNDMQSSLNIDNCTSFSNLLFNISLYDEDAQTLLNGTVQNTSIKVSIELINSTGLQLSNYSYNFNQVNPVVLCSQSVADSSNYTLNGIIEYSSSGRFTEYYYFQNYSFNSLDNLIYLYDLSTTTGQIFKIIYKDTNFVPVTGALINLQRRYIDEGKYKTVEQPKTGAEGYTIGHLVTNDVVYNIIVMKNGVVLATFEDVVAECQTPSLSTCQINLNSYGTSSIPSGFSNINDVTYDLDYNATSRVVDLTYAITSGVSATVILNVSLYDSLGTTLICADSLSASGGDLSCNIPTTFGNGTAIIKVYKNGKEIANAVVKLKNDSRDIYGNNIILLAMIFFLVIVGIGASSDSPMIMGITIILGAVCLVALNILYSPSIIGAGATILWFIIVVVIVMIKGGRKE